MIKALKSARIKSIVEIAEDENWGVMRQYYAEGGAESIVNDETCRENDKIGANFCASKTDVLQPHLFGGCEIAARGKGRKLLADADLWSGVAEVVPRKR